MRIHMKKAWCILLLVSLPVFGQDKTTSAGWAQKRTIPRSVRAEFANLGLDRNYAITYKLYPYYFRGDFNGDGRGDVAFHVENKNSKKSGIVIIQGKWPQKTSAPYYIVGAGKPFGKAGDDAKWMNVWSLIREGKDSRLLGNVKLPSLSGDALEV